MNVVSMSNLSPADLAEAANANLAEHFTWVQKQTPRMHAEIAPDLVWAALRHIQRRVQRPHGFRQCAETHPRGD
jgi:hypothetical protein